MISVVILNWERPFNLTNVILPNLEKIPFVDEIIISHGREDTVFEYESEHCRWVHRRDESLNAEYGLARRFLAAGYARNDTILIVDDDVLVLESSLSELLDEFICEPDVVHGLYGRNPDKRMRYQTESVYGEVTYVTTKVAMFSKDLAYRFFEYAPLMSGLERKGKVVWNGEDMFMSLVAIKTSGRLNRSYPLPRIELEAKGAGMATGICELPGHVEYRSVFSQHAIGALRVGHLVKTSSGGTYRRRIWRRLARVLERGR